MPLGGFPERPRKRFSRFLRRRRSRFVPPDARAAPGLTPSAVQHLWRSYGANWQRVAALAAEEPSLAEPIVGGLDAIKAEIVFAVRHEMARTLGDILARRTHVALLTRDQARSAVPTVAALMARELGWDEAEMARQIQQYDEDIQQFSIIPLQQDLH